MFVGCWLLERLKYSQVTSSERIFVYVYIMPNLYSGFVQHPASQIISYGELATFQCTIRHMRSFTFYWTVNGTHILSNSTLPSEGLHVSSTRSDSITRTTTLAVNGSFYSFNNATIQCRFYDNASALAYLQIRGER